jgi:uncharacterized protein YkwD
LRQATVALLAVPVVAATYVGRLVRRSVRVRVGLTFGLALVLGVGVVGAQRPAVITATPVSPILPLAQAAFTTTFSTGRGLTEPVTIGFTTPMDPASVAAALSVEPVTAVDLAWNATGTVLTVSPHGRWSVRTFETITIRAGALDRSGQPLTRPARAVFLTRDATTGSVVATDRIGERVSTSTSFLVSFATPVDPATVEAAISLDPPTPGTLQSSNPAEGPVRYLFVPSKPLDPDVVYRLVVSGVRDSDGVSVAPVSFAVRTASAPNGPAVVRFRPRANTVGVARDAAISVRFTQPMDRRSTAHAFRVSVGGKAIPGTVRWAESDTVLVFTPATALPFGATVSMDVATAATNRTGVRLASPGHGTFQTVRKTSASTSAAPTGGSTVTAGSAVGGGSWGAVETYYLGLMNCTRTGGWVTATGACSSPGGRNVAPLKLDSGISSKVSRPYAKRIAISGDCSHFIGGNPGDRLRRAGYLSYRWAENLGCGYGDAKAAVLASHLFFQAEKSYLGGHYVNMMNAAYDRVGIGVWVYAGRVRLVIDFYHP